MVKAVLNHYTEIPLACKAGSNMDKTRAALLALTGFNGVFDQVAEDNAQINFRNRAERLESTECWKPRRRTVLRAPKKWQAMALMAQLSQRMTLSSGAASLVIFLRYPSAPSASFFSR